ncbi:MAG TPA: hypothetical protein VHL11_02060, partial [Phototrophicaceae bacterium]|nr:hypothetical protein [Phototrophicaceae bacterium]
HPGSDGEREMMGRFYDASGQRIGALEIIDPVPYVDYTANTDRFGYGFDATADLDVTAELVSGGAVKLTLHNNASETIYLLAGARVRGTPVYPGDSVLVERKNLTAQAENGTRALTLSLPALDAVEDAYQLANFELSRRLTPRGEALTLTLDERTRLEDALALTLFDRVQIVETQTDHDAEYWIVAEAHEVKRGGYQHRVTWTLEPVPPLDYWILETSAFDDETRLAY